MLVAAATTGGGRTAVLEHTRAPPPPDGVDCAHRIFTGRGRRGFLALVPSPPPRRRLVAGRLGAEALRVRDGGPCVGAHAHRVDLRRRRLAIRIYRPLVALVVALAVITAFVERHHRTILSTGRRGGRVRCFVTVGTLVSVISIRLGNSVLPIDVSVKTLRIFSVVAFALCLAFSAGLVGFTGGNCCYRLLCRHPVGRSEEEVRDCGSPRGVAQTSPLLVDGFLLVLLVSIAVAPPAAAAPPLPPTSPPRAARPCRAVGGASSLPVCSALVARRRRARLWQAGYRAALSLALCAFPCSDRDAPASAASRIAVAMASPPPTCFPLLCLNLSTRRLPACDCAERASVESAMSFRAFRRLRGRVLLGGGSRSSSTSSDRPCATACSRTAAAIDHCPQAAGSGKRRRSQAAPQVRENRVNECERVETTKCESRPSSAASLRRGPASSVPLARLSTTA